MSKRKKRRNRSKSRRRHDHHKESPTQSQFAKALMDQSETRQEHLRKAADELRKEMEAQSLRVRDLIQSQPPIQLLGYLLGQLHIGFYETSFGEEDESRWKQKDLIKTFQLALEYVHAVWACHSDLVDEEAALDEKRAGELFSALDELARTTTMYCMASSAANTDPALGLGSSDTEFHAKSTWTLIRGHRYQVLEEEFFRYVLEPHREALEAAYGMTFEAIAANIQRIADSSRVGFSDAVAVIAEAVKQTDSVEGVPDMGAAIEKLRASDGTFDSRVSAAISDMFHGGICNLSTHTSLSPRILEDLAYVPGENTEFFAEGDFRGTPMRTLPARVKPAIKLGEDYYAPDNQFVRDSAYRAIQRGLLRRLPDYREQWNQRQKHLVERAYPTIFHRQLRGAAVYSEVYFKDATTGQWVETDSVIALSDVLLVIEAKAGVMAMHSPATDFDRHERVIRELIIKAYEQCKRFLDYLGSAPEVSLYARVDNQFVEVARLRRSSYRLILPIGLTVESFTPFSAMCKDFPEIQPLLGRHPFVSMSVDDLFVLDRFLPTTGELLHYLEVRQQVAGIRRAMLFDEIDHLGAYINNNRFDMSIRDQLKKADMVTWDSFGDVVDKYFEGDKWKTESPPHQDFPELLADVLAALDAFRPPGWLLVDAHLRNLGGKGRQNFVTMLGDLKATLSEYPLRRFLIGGDGTPILVWLCRRGSEPSQDEMQRQGQISCLAAGVPMVPALRLSFSSEGKIVDAACSSFLSPTVIQANYPDLLREAERQKTRLKTIGKPGRD